MERGAGGCSRACVIGAEVWWTRASTRTAGEGAGATFTSALGEGAAGAGFGDGADAGADDVGLGAAGEELAEDVLEDASVLVVENLLRRVDADDGVELGDG